MKDKNSGENRAKKEWRAKMSTVRIPEKSREIYQCIGSFYQVRYLHCPGEPTKIYSECIVDCAGRRKAYYSYEIFWDRRAFQFVKKGGLEGHSSLGAEFAIAGLTREAAIIDCLIPKILDIPMLLRVPADEIEALKKILQEVLLPNGWKKRRSVFDKFIEALESDSAYPLNEAIQALTFFRDDEYYCPREYLSRMIGAIGNFYQRHGKFELVALGAIENLKRQQAE